MLPTKTHKRAIWSLRNSLFNKRRQFSDWLQKAIFGLYVVYNAFFRFLCFMVELPTHRLVLMALCSWQSTLLHLSKCSWQMFSQDNTFHWVCKRLWSEYCTVWCISRTIQFVMKLIRRFTIIHRSRAEKRLTFISWLHFRNEIQTCEEWKMS